MKKNIRTTAKLSRRKFIVGSAAAATPTGAQVPVLIPRWLDALSPPGKAIRALVPHQRTLKAVTSTNQIVDLLKRKLCQLVVSGTNFV